MLSITTRVPLAVTTCWALSPGLFPGSSCDLPRDPMRMDSSQTSQIADVTSVFVEATNILKWASAVA